MYMIINKILDVPTIKGVPLNTVMRFLQSKSSSKSDQVLMDNRMEPFKYEQEVVREVKKKYPYNWKEIYEILTQTYPPRIFMNGTFKTYSSENIWEKDENYLKVWDDYNKWHNEFNNLVENLKIKGVINPRWINEFSLYVITDAFFPDAIYQYSVEWLGRQSLDIYIPSINTGIEYQGQQHYEPVDFFGGEEGYIKLKELDERKKVLCQENNVKLIEWPYTEEVNLSNFYKMLKDYKIKKSIVSDKKLKTYNESLVKNNILNKQ